DPSVGADLDLAALGNFLTYFYIPGEKTLFKDIYKLRPGHYLTVRDGQLQVTQYWDLHFDGPQRAITVEKTLSELDELLRDAVREHMISDVPVGVLLSGGVDSTAMLSYAVEY